MFWYIFSCFIHIQICYAGFHCLNVNKYVNIIHFTFSVMVIYECSPFYLFIFTENDAANVHEYVNYAYLCSLEKYIICVLHLAIHLQIYIYTGIPNTTHKERKPSFLTL